MKVSLLTYTPRPDNIVAAAARECYQSHTSNDNMIKRLLKSRHMSVFEHANFTFKIEGISRVCSHQLVRHRVASYSQKSQRYVEEIHSDDIVFPPSIVDNDNLSSMFMKAAYGAFAAYETLIKSGVPKEDARYILPHGWETSLVMTMNARELHHFFSLRTCRRAQWEIRELGMRMLYLVREAAPLIFEVAGCGCLTGGCKECPPCGRPYKNINEALIS